jgi:chromate transporter
VNILLQLAALFGKLSVLAVGGVNSTLPSIARAVVDERHWMTREQFAQLFAIAQSAPGPNMLVVVLIGQRVGGVAGGVVAGLAMILPAGVLVLLVAGAWERFRQARWRRVLQAAILPITGGLVLAAAAVLVEAADRSVLLVGVTGVAAAVSYWSRLHPLWVLAAGSLAGLVAGGM